MKPMRSLILEQTIAALYWVMLIAALWVLLRGHNEPGGGFIAALLAVAASCVYALVFGPDAARHRLPLPPMTLAALGLGLAVASGLPGLLSGNPFLSHLWGELPLGVGSLKLSTVMLFDLGVLLCVWGSLAGFCLRLLEAR
ncbi:MAG: MnhB domain-containing protein [Rhodocyclaceae bacterium]